MKTPFYKILLLIFLISIGKLTAQNPGSDDKAPKKGLVENKREIRKKLKKESKERRRKEKAEQKMVFYELAMKAKLMQMVS